ASKQQLAWFFDQWLTRPGFPEVTATWSYDSTAHEVSVALSQSNRFGTFQFPLTVAVIDSSGAEHRASTRFSLEYSSPQLRIPSPTVPARIVLDPNVDLLASFKVVPAQSIRLADSLLERGALDRAESLYYAAVRARPHDAVARWALGRYLAERGAPRVAATLMEEALRFGGDSHMIGPDLAALYERLDEYRELLALGGAPLSAGERNRASWLLEHPTRVIAPDTLLVAQYREAPGPSGYLGTLTIRVNGRPLDAAIAPRASGLVIADTNAIVQRLHRFPTPAGSAARGNPSLAAVADSIGIGRLSLTNVPVSVAPIDGGYQAAIGVDLLDRFAPTFDARAS